MPKVKHTADRRKIRQRHPRQSLVDNVFDELGQDGDSNEAGPRFLTPLKEMRYNELKKWNLISERRVELNQGEYDAFLIGLEMRNWHTLMNPKKKFDSEVIYEFYANAWAEKQLPEERKTKVQGKWVYYHPEAINELLGTPYPDQSEPCAYQKEKASPTGFDPSSVAHVLCLPGRSFQRGSKGQPKRIIRKDMRTLAQVWLTFMLANITPSGHVSDLNMGRCHLLYCLMRDDQTVDVAKIISDEIQKFVDLEMNHEKGKRFAALGFPALINMLCNKQGVLANVNTKIRPPIDKKFIDKNCTNPDEHPDAVNRPAPQPDTPLPPEMKAMESRIMRRIKNTERQLSAIHRALMHMHNGAYHAVPAYVPNEYMPPEQFSAYVNWPGDMPSHRRGGTAAAGAGTAAAGTAAAGADETASAAAAGVAGTSRTRAGSSSAGAGTARTRAGSSRAGVNVAGSSRTEEDDWESEPEPLDEEWDVSTEEED